MSYEISVSELFSYYTPCTRISMFQHEPSFMFFVTPFLLHLVISSIMSIIPALKIYTGIHFNLLLNILFSVVFAQLDRCMQK